MRIVHTSDWHLGRSFHGFGLLDAQAAFVDWLVALVGAEGVDTVVVSGDVFDRAIPPVDAVELYDDALSRLADTGAALVVISGNHDSAERLGVGSRLLDRAGVHVRTDPGGVGVPVLLGDEAGTVAVYPVPYLEPDAVRGVLGVAGRGHQATLDVAMTRVRADLAGRGAGTRSVVLAHAFVAGGLASDSERDIRVGGASWVATSTFTGIGYAALGHLHGAQRLTESICYSGSPIAYSFSEAAHRKSVTLVELGARGDVRTERVETPVRRGITRVSGRLDEILSAPALACHESDFLAVTLTDPGAPANPMPRLRERFPHVATLDWQPEGGLRHEDRAYGDLVSGRSEEEICLEFVEHVRNDAARPRERTLLAQALEAARHASPDASPDTSPADAQPGLAAGVERPELPAARTPGDRAYASVGGST